MNILKELKLIFLSKPEPSYWEIRRELDIEHDRMVEEFSQRDRDWTRRREEIAEVLRLSSVCSNIVYVLMKKGYISHDLWFDLLKDPELTAYLPIEVGPALKKVSEEGDTLTLLEIYKTNLK